ncbi:MAG: transglutaminase-like domain-containing protein [Rickettsiales bacterium]|jgi:hypothetical protein|nr:transglutaminase-like domain-containing protein [Rickettsiales bacterium]
MGNAKKYWTLLLLAIGGPVFADLRIESWDQKNMFNDRGQEVEVVMKLKAEELLQNHYYDNWSMIFDKKSRVSILEARAVNDGECRGTFGGNKLEFRFRKLFNSQDIILKFRYQIDNDEIFDVPYIRRESVSIPAFAKGARASLEVQTLDNMNLYSLNYLFHRNRNSFRWDGIVGEDGFRDVFSMTRNSSRWNVSTIIDIEDSDGIGNLVVKLPLDYVGGNNEIVKYNVSSGQVNRVDGDFIEKGDDNITVNFRNFASRKSFVRIAATIENDYSDFNWVNNFKFAATTKIVDDYIAPLSSLVGGIDGKGDRRLATYIRIAKWVHENIVYDESYVGKKMTSLDILRVRRGVCEHYAILYQDLLRSINIPSKTIVGLSYNFEKKKFENHAWVMVYHNNEWIPIDPTWGIYSGKLPISHIFMYNDIGNSVSYSRVGSLDSLRTKIRHQVEFIE